MKKRIFSVIVGLVGFASTTWAQNEMHFPYFCGFETTKEADGWQLVNENSNPNKWVIGKATASDGNKSLYISPDNGASASYKAASGLQIAYKDFTLPVGSRYEIAFDWKCMGNLTDRMYVCWLPAAQPIGPSNYASLPTWLTSYWIQWSGNALAGDTVMFNARNWQHGQFEVPGTGIPYRLVFCWVSSDTGEQPISPAGCIDNVQIGKKMACAKPQALDYLAITDASGLFAWYGNSEQYELKYRNTKSSFWTEHKGLTQTVDSIKGLTKGTYTIWVRGICGQDTSIWSVYNNLLVYVSSEMCVDYINIKNTDVAIADIGKVTGVLSDPYMFLGMGVVDFGSASAASSHTVHYDVEETDPRTGHKLKTVPEGEVASVRLGNWGVGGNAERITYFCTVDSTMSILLLKYAVVLENPNHHENEQPRFTLKMLDEYGRQINPTCGAADFIPNKNTAQWHKTGTVEWKDWTTLGLNLEDYIGQTIQIQLATYDCTLSGHYGYAYFTLDCAAARISGLSCGDNTVEALGVPEGFSYKWYRADKPDSIVSTTNKFLPQSNDTADYVCRLTYLEDNKESSQCYFELTASLLPRFPSAGMEYSMTEKECEVEVAFTNKSYVYTRKGVETNQCDAYFWDFGDGTTSYEENPIHTYKRYGVYTVTLKASIANGECEDIFTQVIDATFDKEPVQIAIPDSLFEVCPEAGEFVLPYQLIAGNLDSCEVEYETGEKVKTNVTANSLSVPTVGMKPGYYQALLLVYGHCVADTIPFTYRVDYPGEVLAQRWNDVIGLRNEQHNGGYDFTGATLQWYENGMPIEGQNGTVLYQQGTQLNPNSYYQLGITHNGEQELLSCPFTPVMLTPEQEEIRLEQTFYQSGSEATIKAVAKAQAKIYDGMGVICDEFCFEEGMNVISLPQRAGIYIIEMTLLDGRQMVQKIVIQ